MTVTVSIVIVLYNCEATLTACLQSIRRAVGHMSVELITVDNGSSDDSVTIVEREFPNAERINLGENRGFAAGVNAGVAKATGRYWLLLNPDVKVPVDGLEMLVAWMDGQTDVGVASPYLQGPTGNRNSPARALPTITRTVLELTRLHLALPRDIRSRVMHGPYARDHHQCDAEWVPGTAMIVRPAAAEEVGQFSEDFFMYGEDVEYCWRVRQAGWRIGICSTTTFEHAESSSAKLAFGPTQTTARVAAGMHNACRLIYGQRRARVLAMLTAVAYVIESRAPKRSAAYRAQARQAERIWWHLAQCR